MAMHVCACPCVPCELMYILMSSSLMDSRAIRLAQTLSDVCGSTNTSSGELKALVMQLCSRAPHLFCDAATYVYDALFEQKAVQRLCALHDLHAPGSDAAVPC